MPGMCYPERSRDKNEVQQIGLAYRDIMSPLQGWWINNGMIDRAHALSYILSPLRGLS